MFELQSIDLFAIVPGYIAALKDDFVFEVESYDYNSLEQQKEIAEVRKEQQLSLDRKVVDVESLNRVCSV
jgi:hypothetical protein